jgi:hypothetical protein
VAILPKVEVLTGDSQLDSSRGSFAAFYIALAPADLFLNGSADEIGPILFVLKNSRNPVEGSFWESSLHILRPPLLSTHTHTPFLI